MHVLKVCVVVVLVVVIIVATLLVTVSNDDTKSSSNDKWQGVEDNGPVFKYGAVTANGQECAGIGSDILERGGSAADAAIAALFCDGVACSQCMGLGGGFLLTSYTRATGKIRILNARELAPAASTEDMFEGGAISTTTGGMAAAVPGELRGYKALYDQLGKLPWAELVQPSIKLCREGFLVTEYLARILKAREDRIKNEPSLSEVYINPATDSVWLQGEKIKNLKLADTLEIVATEGPDALHNGSLTQRFVNDVKAAKGIITVEDMNNYQAVWQEPIQIDLGAGLTLNTVPLPGTGHVLALIINMLKGWVVADPDDPSTDQELPKDRVTYYHRIVESYKYAYAKRTGLGDPSNLPDDKIRPLLENMTSVDYAHYLRSLVSDTETHNNWTHYGAEFGLLEDHGTAHISVVAPNGDAIAVTSTINYILGAFFRSPSTGIILNNEMDDFSHPNVTNIYDIPPSPTNYPAPGKRPLSSMNPAIIVEKGRGFRLVIGAAGGTKITTQVALVVLHHLLEGIPLQAAIDLPRLHHQLFPMHIDHEAAFEKDILAGLRRIGHNTTELSATAGFASMTAISINRTTGLLVPRFDNRRPGSYAGF